jgi:long-chain acyl-CoA synthetase
MLSKQFVTLSESHRANVALIHRDRAFSGSEIEAEADRLADRLQSLGVSVGDRVAILSGNTPLFVIAMLAVMKLDASCVLLSTHFRQTELSDAMARTGPALLISTEDAAPCLEQLQLESAGELSVVTAPLKIWQTLTSQMRALENELIVQFTSGVSGRSKIVPRTETNLLNELTGFAHDLKLASGDAVVCPAPLFHAYGLVNGFLLPFFVGATTILIDWFLPNDVIDVVRRYRPTVLVGVPAMYKALSEAYGAEAEDLSSLRVCFSAGAPLTQSLLDKFRDRYKLNIHQQYGSTETGVIALNLQPTADVNPLKPLSAGLALSGSEIQIVKNGQRVAPGEEGEVIVRSPGSAVQYLNDPELTAQKFRDGWYRTGDVGRTSANGELQLIGRLSSLINVAGLKVDPNEVEAALKSCDAVAECAVVGIPDPSTGHDLVKAFVIARRETSRQELLAFCRPKLAAYKLPRQVEFVEALPKSATGKILVKYLLGAPESVAKGTGC